jgi:hypothetical protein
MIDSDVKRNFMGHVMARHNYSEAEREQVFAEPGDRVSFIDDKIPAATWSEATWRNFRATRQVFLWECDPYQLGMEGLLAEGALEPEHE